MPFSGGCVPGPPVAPINALAMNQVGVFLILNDRWGGGCLLVRCLESQTNRSSSLQGATSEN